MNLARCSLIACALAAGARAQDQATTLLAEVRGADVVVRAQVTVASEPSPDWRRLQFTTELVLAGDAPATFAVLEPAGACCGRSLFALEVGDRRLLFLRRTGSTWHALGGARGVVPAEPAIVAHVQQLLEAPNAAALAHLLAQSLDHDEPRIADDAADALAALPQLSLAAADRAAVGAALQRSLAHRTTRCAPLADVAARLHDDGSVDALLDGYFAAEHDDQARLLRGALCRCATATLPARLAARLDEQRAPRAAELLLALPAGDARTVLGNLLERVAQPRVQLCVAQALLANGADGRALAAHFPTPVLELATRRQQQPRRFRAIDPERR
jgi:hypothetical protein